MYLMVTGLSYSSSGLVMASQPNILPPFTSQRSPGPLCFICSYPAVLGCAHCPTGPAPVFCSVAHYHEVRCICFMSYRARLITLAIVQHWWKVHGGTGTPIHTGPRVDDTSVPARITPSASAPAYMPSTPVEVRQETVISYVLGVRNGVSYTISTLLRCTNICAYYQPVLSSFPFLVLRLRSMASIPSRFPNSPRSSGTDVAHSSSILIALDFPVPALFICFTVLAPMSSARITTARPPRWSVVRIVHVLTWCGPAL